MIHIHNDGKGKRQSFEASIGDKDEFGNKLLAGEGVTGYGATQEEAIAELKTNVQNYLDSIAVKLAAVDYTQTIPTDWQGKPLTLASFYR